MKKSEQIREEIALSNSQITDEQLNVMLGIFTLCNTYNYIQGGELSFGESLKAVMDSIHNGFCSEIVYNFCIESLKEMQDESVIITLN